MSSRPIIQPQAILQTLWKNRLRWIIPTAAITVAAALYALVMPPTWQARQALSIRDEAGSREFARPGRFGSAEAMKTAQETVLELAKSRGVAEAALVQVGPPAGKSAADWPAAADIETLQDAVEVRAASGAEFGHTEVFYLTVKDHDRQRAVALAGAVCDRLEARLQELRDDRAQSMIGELQKSVELARGDLSESTSRLSQMERGVGADLAELRVLSEASAGESNLSQTLIQIKSEVRQAEQNRRTNEMMLEILAAAQDDPTQLVATPSHLLESLPALRQLRDGLIAAQLRRADLLGTMTKEHPRVLAAMDAEEQIRRDLFAETHTATATLLAEQRIGAARRAALEARQADVLARMERLAAMRAEYANLTAEVKQRAEGVSSAQRDLADARASLAAAHSSSLLTRIDRPVTGDRPAGPGRAMILLLGLAGGLVTGLGIVFLTVPLEPAPAPQSASGQVAGAAVVTELAGRAAGKGPVRGLTLSKALQHLSQAASIMP